MKRIQSHRTAFTIVELLVVIAIIGMLVGLLLPAVHAARESGRRTTCANNLKQLGVAIHTFHHARRQLPTSNRPMGVATAPRLSWVTQLLPYLEQQNIYDEYDFSRNWSDNNPPAGPRKLTNAELSSVRIPLLECPTAPEAGTLDGDLQFWTITNSSGGQAYPDWESSRCAAPTNYSPIVQVEAHVYSAVLSTAPPADTSGMMQRNMICTIDQISDGTSNTLLLAESAGRPFVYRRGAGKVGSLSASRVNGGGWARPASDYGLDGSSKDGTVFPGPCAINCTNGEDYVKGSATPAVPIPLYGTYSTAETFSFHAAGANTVFGDGAVRFLDESIDMEVFTQLVTRKGREVIRGIVLQ